MPLWLSDSKEASIHQGGSATETGAGIHTEGCAGQHGRRRREDRISSGRKTARLSFSSVDEILRHPLDRPPAPACRWTTAPSRPGCLLRCRRQGAKPATPPSPKCIRRSLFFRYLSVEIRGNPCVPVRFIENGRTRHTEQDLRRGGLHRFSANSASARSLPEGLTARRNARRFSPICCEKWDCLPFLRVIDFLPRNGSGAQGILFSAPGEPAETSRQRVGGEWARPPSGPTGTTGAASSPMSTFPGNRGKLLLHDIGTGRRHHEDCWIKQATHPFSKFCRERLAVITSALVPFILSSSFVSSNSSFPPSTAGCRATSPVDFWLVGWRQGILLPAGRLS